MKKYVAEFLGTFVLTLGILISLATNPPIPTPIIAGITVGLFVFTVGKISGAQFNPAITIGVWSLGKMSTRDAVIYMICQCVAALAAWHVSTALFVPKQLVVANTFQVGLGEALGTFILAFGIATVIHGKVVDTLAGFVIGGSLIVGAIVASMASNSALNPAVALGIGSLSGAYIVGPIVGSVAGMQFAKFLQTK